MRLKTKIIPMTYDFVFKSVLQDESCEDYLVDILSNIINIEKKYIKGNIVFKNTELPKYAIKEKGKTTDLIIELKDNIINLEMNKTYYDGLYDKNDRYIDKLKDGIITSGDIYNKRKQLIQINFDDFEVFDDRKIIKFEMMDKERGIIRSDYVCTTNIIIYHINLKSIRKMYYNKDNLSKFDKELLLMTIDDTNELKNISKGCLEMENVTKKISKITKYEEMQGIYDKEEQEQLIKNLIKQHAARKGYEEGMAKGMKEGREKGMEEGMERGLEQGIEQGREQGLEQGIEQGIEKGIEQNKIKVAINLLKNNVDLNIISSSTGLSLDEINKLK